MKYIKKYNFMKYLKKYESVDVYKYYWKVPTQMPNFEIALRKLEKSYQCDFNITDFYYVTKKPKFKGPYIYICVDYSPPFNEWHWDDKDNDIKKEFEFLSEIKITEDDIKNYYIEKNMDAYNL